MMEADTGMMILLALKLEKGPGTKECGQPLDAGKARPLLLLLSFQKECSPADTLRVR